MKYKALLALLLLSSLVFIGPACNRASYGADDKSKIHVGIVFDIGGKDDRSFNAAAWVGTKCAETGRLYWLLCVGTFRNICFDGLL